MLYDVQITGGKGQFTLRTDLISSNKRRIFNRVREVTKSGRQARVLDRSGRVLEAYEVQDMDRG